MFFFCVIDGTVWHGANGHAAPTEGGAGLRLGPEGGQRTNFEYYAVV